MWKWYKYVGPQIVYPYKRTDKEKWKSYEKYFTHKKEDYSVDLLGVTHRRAYRFSSSGRSRLFLKVYLYKPSDQHNEEYRQEYHEIESDIAVSATVLHDPDIVEREGPDYEGYHPSEDLHGEEYQHEDDKADGYDKNEKTHKEKESK